MKHGFVFTAALALQLVACAPEESHPMGDATVRSDAGSRADASSQLDAAVPSDTGVAPRDAGAPPQDTGVGDPYNAARDSCVAEINRYRAMLMLPPYERWREGEACADQMARFDAMTGQPHNGFNMRVCSPGGMGQNECPRYGGPEALNGCLAQMWAEGPSPTGEWDIAHGHYLNMVGNYTYMGHRQNFTRVACGFSAGGWMVQNFQ